jgi:hypothetical protein
MQDTNNKANNADDDFYAGLTKSQICVIAQKTNTDSTVLLEKKLKSRFSHALPVSCKIVHAMRVHDHADDVQ